MREVDARRPLSVQLHDREGNKVDTMIYIYGKDHQERQQGIHRHIYLERIADPSFT
jgi:hypothetical protein